MLYLFHIYIYVCIMYICFLWHVLWFGVTDPMHTSASLCTNTVLQSHIYDQLHEYLCGEHILKVSWGAPYIIGASQWQALALRTRCS